MFHKLGFRRFVFRYIRIGVFSLELYISRLACRSDAWLIAFFHLLLLRILLLLSFSRRKSLGREKSRVTWLLPHGRHMDTT